MIGDITGMFAPSGWICPKCGRVMSPSQMYCPWCSEQEVTLTMGTGTSISTISRKEEGDTYDEADCAWK